MERHRDRVRCFAQNLARHIGRCLGGHAAIFSAPVGGRSSVSPACCLPGGSCEILPEQHCPGDFMGHGTVCDPNPCEPPVPVGMSSWGQMKLLYR